MKIVQLLLLCITLILWTASLAHLFRARVQHAASNYARIWASTAILFLIIGLLLPWSSFPPDLANEQRLTENLDEIHSVILLMAVTLAAWVIYRKYTRPRRFFSLTLALVGLVILALAWFSFTFAEDKASLISANEAYISTLIQPNVGYYLSLVGGLLLSISGILGSTQTEPIIQKRT